MLDSDLTDKAPEICLIPANYKRNFQRKGFLWQNSISVHKAQQQETRGKGFTLAELLIVTGIVSILVAVSIPIMSGQVQKAKEVRAKARRGFYCMALWMYLHDLDEQDIHPEAGS